MSAAPRHRIVAEREDNETGDVVRVVCGCGVAFVDDDTERISALGAYRAHLDALSLAARAKEAQDRIGWTDYTEPAALADATLALARLVVELAREVERLRDASPEP